MPFTFPTKLTCPFCFGRFHIGFAPIRDFSISDARDKRMDDILNQFLESHGQKVILNMAPADLPSGGFWYCLTGEPARRQRDWWDNKYQTFLSEHKWLQTFLSKHKWLRDVKFVPTVLSFLPIFVVALFRGMLWPLWFVYFSPVGRSAKLSQQRICPHCHIPLPGVMADKGVASILVAITGYKNAGKSNFIPILIKRLEDHCKEMNFSIVPANTFSIEHVGSRRTSDVFERLYGSIYREDHRGLPGNTRSAEDEKDLRMPLIYRLTVEHDERDWIRKAFSKSNEVDLAFFDMAGEDLSILERRNRRGHHILNASGIVTLISLTDYDEIRRCLSNPPDLGDLQPTTADTDLISYLPPKERQKPLAIVLAKLDELEALPDYRENEGDFRKLFQDHYHSKGYNVKAGNTASGIVQDFLEKYGFKLLLQSVKSHFPNHCYFAISSWGRRPKPSASGTEPLGPPEPKNIADPLFWILYKIGILRDAGKEFNTFRTLANFLSRAVASLMIMALAVLYFATIMYVVTIGFLGMLDLASAVSQAVSTRAIALVTWHSSTSHNEAQEPPNFPPLHPESELRPEQTAPYNVDNDVTVKKNRPFAFPPLSPGEPVYHSPYSDIFKAVKDGTAKDVEYFINKGANLNNLNADGYAPLHLAAIYHSDTAIMEKLIEYGADVNVEDPLRWTPLDFIAFKNPNPEIRRFLVSKGAKLKMRNESGGPSYDSRGVRRRR